MEGGKGGGERERWGKGKQMRVRVGREGGRIDCKEMKWLTIPQSWDTGQVK